MPHTNSINIEEGQTIWDVAIQHTGSAATAFAIAVQNNFPLTGDIGGGTIPPQQLVFVPVVNRLAAAKVVPASFGYDI